MKKICINEKCTGCGACYNICPKGAITMQWDEYGFYKPVIDEGKCINCGLCERICPLGNYKSQNIEQPQVYAFQNDDKETLYKCASGGAFAKLAKYVIEQGGIVYGVIYDENMVVCHSRTGNLADLEKMYSSKYVQSDTRTTFKQTKEDLENGKTVLYSGTPCQIAGLKSYLQKDYENLITVDLICHGVPSPLIFEKYKQEYMAKLSKGEKLKNINFRAKDLGWGYWKTLKIDTSFHNNLIIYRKSSYMQLFGNNLSINSSCICCQFNKLPRVSDITIGDFWGVDEYDKSLNNKQGLSIVLLNSSKSEMFFEQIKNNSFVKEVPLDFVIKYNPNIVTSSKPHLQRQDFFEDIKNNKSLEFCLKKYCKAPYYKKIYWLLPLFMQDFIKYKIFRKKND